MHERDRCSPTPEGTALTAGDRQAIEALAAAYSAHALAGDFDAWLELFRADAVRMNPGLPPLEGREAIGEWVHGFDFSVRSHEMSVSEIEGTRELACVRGSYRSELVVRVDGEEVVVPDEGSWLAVVRRDEHDAWKFYRFIHNTDISPAPPESQAAEAAVADLDLPGVSSRTRRT